MEYCEPGAECQWHTNSLDAKLRPPGYEPCSGWVLATRKRKRSEVACNGSVYLKNDPLRKTRTTLRCVTNVSNRNGKTHKLSQWFGENEAPKPNSYYEAPSRTRKPCNAAH